MIVSLVPKFAHVSQLLRLSWLIVCICVILYLAFAISLLLEAVNKRQFTLNPNVDCILEPLIQTADNATLKVPKLTFSIFGAGNNTTSSPAVSKDNLAFHHCGFEFFEEATLFSDWRLGVIFNNEDIAAYKQIEAEFKLKPIGEFSADSSSVYFSKGHTFLHGFALPELSENWNEIKINLVLVEDGSDLEFWLRLAINDVIGGPGQLQIKDLKFIFSY